MKTWITYIAAVALGLSSSLLLTDIVGYTTFITHTALIMTNIGMFVIFPLAFFSASSAIASLQRDNKLATSLFTFVIWTLLTSILLPFIAALCYVVVPTFFPASSTSGTDTTILRTISGQTFFSFLETAFSPNSFYQFVSSSSSLIPILLFSWILGYALKPTSDIIRPSYVVFNSFTEVLYRLTHKFTQFMPILIIFISSSFFSNIISRGEFAATFVNYFSIIIFITLLFAFGLIPLTFAIITKFKVNPYKIYFRAIASHIAAFFSGNVLFAASTLMVLDRKNNGIQKRIIGLSTPLATIFTRGGSASIATLVTLSVMASAANSSVNFLTAMLVALGCFLVSFISSASLGYEVLFISIASMRFLGISLPGTQLSIIAFIPILNALGAVLDIQLWNYGNYIVGKAQNTNCNISRGDLV